MIFCLSQIHTGTQTTLAWLCEHQDVDGMLLSTGVHKICGGLVDSAEISHDWESGNYQECFSQKMVYHEHLRIDYLNPFRMCRTQLVMANLFPTIIPIRDPLAAMISYQHRSEMRSVPGQWHPDLDLFNRWGAMAEVYPRLKDAGVQFVPWDLWDAGNLGVANVESYLGILEARPIPIPRNNRSKPYPLRTDYVMGNVDGLREGLITHLWRDLSEREAILRPMLEDIGYRDLLWWS